MSETTNISNFDFYLEFEDFGEVQIDEPIGIDVINLVTEADDGRYARDVFFGGNDKVKLRFTSEKGSKNLGYALDKLIETDKRTGFESVVNFKIKNRVTDEYFIFGKLDFEAKDTDHYSYFECNIVQEKNQALLKRLEDVKIDVFSEEDLDGNAIDPVSFSNILIPSKPKVQKSRFIQGSDSSGRLNISTFSSEITKTIVATNNAFNQELYGIQNTLSFFATSGAVSTIDGELTQEGFTFLEAEQDLTDVQFEFSNLLGDYTFIATDTSTDEVESFSGGVRLVIKTGLDVSNIYNTYTVWDAPIEYENGDLPIQNFTIPTELSYNIDYIPAGLRVYIYFEPYGDAVFSGSPPYSPDPFGAVLAARVLIGLERQTLDITTTSIGVDTVTKGVRLLDASKGVANRINQDLTFVAPRLDNGGEHYNQFLFSGDMVRGRENPFNIEWKQIKDYYLSEPNLDYQVLGDTVFIGKEDDYYPNVEIAVFQSKPETTFNITNNPRFTTNTVESAFKSFNQDKDDENTIDAVHTEMQLVNANRNVQDTKAIECDFIRDPFLLGTTQEKAASENTSSLSQDEKIFIGDCISVAPSQTGFLQRVLTHNVSDGNLRILGEGFNWTILGFVIGDILTLNNTDNTGTYEVVEITNNIVTLQPLSATPTSIGRVLTQITYPLTNVQYVLRTNEGFDLIEGVESPNQYANLRYTIKRSLIENYGAYLRTATIYKPEDIKVTSFKNDVNLTTQFNGEAVINELAPITQEDLPNPILTPRMITCKVLCTFDEYVDFKTKLETINDTGTYVKTIGGFVRVYDTENRLLKGYPRKSDFTWNNGVMEFELEEKWESDTTNITYEGNVYFINEVGYDLDGVTILNYAHTDTNYIQFFDENTAPLTNRLRYDKVSVDGVVYDSINELKQAIADL